MAAEIQKLMQKGLVFLFPKNCFEELVLHFHIFHGEFVWCEGGEEE